MPSGLQSLPVVSVVRPRTSPGPPRTILNFSAPAFSGGGVAPAGRPALPYTPERSGLPSGIRAPAATGGGVERAAGGALPSTVTTSVRDGPPFAVNVYVVVPVGITCRLPRGVTAPTPGSMATPEGFSTCHINSTGCPARTVAGFASNDTILGSSPGCAPRPPRPPCAAGAGAGAGACAPTLDHARMANTTGSTRRTTRRAEPLEPPEPPEPREPSEPPEPLEPTEPPEPLEPTEPPEPLEPTEPPEPLEPTEPPEPIRTSSSR